MRALHWFRSDLRSIDNTALSAACSKSDEGVVALFVISPAEWLAHDVAPVRLSLMLRTLRELSTTLAALNIPLLIAHAAKPADVPRAVLEVARRHNCAELFFNKEYEVNEASRDAATIAAFQNDGRRAHAFTDQSVVEPGDVRTGEGRFFTVFTPFKKALYKHLQAKGGVSTRPAPRKQPATNIRPDPVPESIAGFESTIAPELWPAGEAHAQKRLDTFITRHIAQYKDRRDFPAQDATSVLSPYLAIGAISPRQCIAAALAANSRSASPFDTGPEGITHWISEVVWREFYIHIVAGFPRVCMHRAFQIGTDRIVWNRNEAHLEAWKRGRTGVPIVDAGMRQLLATGWMHNRVRMVVAMYLTKNLLTAVGSGPPPPAPTPPRTSASSTP